MATQEQLLGAILSAMTGTTGHGGTAEQSLSGILAEVQADGNMPAANLLALKSELPTAAVIASQLGERLIASLQAVWPSNAGTAHFSTTKATAGAVLVKTSTGYARLINADGTLGTQAGTGSSSSYITLTFTSSGGHRALGVVSVANTGAVQFGNIIAFTSFTNQLTSFSGIALANLISLQLDDNQISSFSGTALLNLNYLSLSANLLTTAGQDAAFNSLSVSAEANAGAWYSNTNIGAPSAASATKRAAMVAGGWTITF